MIETRRRVQESFAHHGFISTVLIHCTAHLASTACAMGLWDRCGDAEITLGMQKATIR